jgi:hypothetical protein
MQKAKEADKTYFVFQGVQLSHSVFMLRLEHIQFPLGLVVDLQ